MPLTAVDFVPRGPIRSADIKQFVDLFTGVMIDQPITFRNSVAIGGNQGQTQAALSLYGAVNQTSNLINLYPSVASLNPTFGFAASGAFGWGPGGNLVQDTFLSRIGTQNGHVTDTPGLLLQPNIEVTGSIFCDGPISFPTGGAITDGGAAGIHVGQDLTVQRNLYIGNDHVQVIAERAGGGAVTLQPTLLIHGADAAASGLTYANAHLQVRGDDMADAAGTMITASSAYIFSTNWLEFDVHFYKITAGVGWPGTACLLDYDVDASNAAGGRISMVAGRIGIAGIANPNGDAMQVFGNATINGILSTTGGALIQGGLTVNANLVVGTNVAIAGALAANSIQCNTNLNVDTITIDSAANSMNAKLAFNQAVGPKINLYDSGGGQWFGFGINASEMYACIPNTATFNIRAQNQSGPILWSFGGNGGISFGSPGGNQISMDPNGPQITFVTPNDPQGGGQLYRNIKPSSRPASSVGGGEIQIDLRLYVDGDITAGTYVHGIQFIQTSDPQVKANAIVMPDLDCMTMIRDPALNVYTYQITPPVSGGYPAPTPTDIGFMANEVYAAAPQFSALDSTNHPVAVNYSNMAALLWGALRQLDARCVAKGI